MTTPQIIIRTCMFAVTMALTATSSFSQTTCEPNKVAVKYPTLAGKVVKIGADPQTPPYVFKDGKDFNSVSGIDVELARAVLECAGLKHEFILGSWSSLMPALQAGKLHVLWDNLYYKPERAKLVDFVTYMAAGTGALVGAGNPKKVRSMESLCGLSVSFGSGSSMEGTVKKQDENCKSKGLPAINMVAFQDLASGLLRLDSGRSDVILWDLAFVDNLAQTNVSKYTRAFAIMDGFVIGAAVQKGQAELLSVLHDGLSVMQRNGTQGKIFKKHGIDPSLILTSERRIN